VGSGVLKPVAVLLARMLPFPNNATRDPGEIEVVKLATLVAEIDGKVVEAAAITSRTRPVDEVGDKEVAGSGEGDACRVHRRQICRTAVTGEAGFTVAREGRDNAVGRYFPDHIIRVVRDEKSFLWHPQRPSKAAPPPKSRRRRHRRNSAPVARDSRDNATGRHLPDSLVDSIRDVEIPGSVYGDLPGKSPRQSRQPASP